MDRKKAARLFWSVKGYLLPDDWSEKYKIKNDS